MHEKQVLPDHDRRSGDFRNFQSGLAILKVIVENEMAAALPHRVLPAIIKAMPRYFLLAGLLLAGIVLSILLETLLSRIPWAGGLLAAGTSLYFMMAQARLGGVFYRDQWAAEAEEETAEAEDAV